MQIEPFSISGSEILSRPTPRIVRLTAYGFAAYGFIIALLSAMIVGPAAAFLLQDSADRTLLERGVLTHFDLTASEPTRQGDGQHIDYVFKAQDAMGAGASKLRSGHSVVSNSEMAAFANPNNRYVLYDPVDPRNVTAVTSRSALARRRDFNRMFAVLAYPLWLVVTSSVVAFGVRFLRRKLRLLRSGLATAPTMTRCREGQPRVEFRFTDADGNGREGCQSYNFRVGIGTSFTPYMRDAIVFYDRNNPENCDLFLPDVSTFRFART